ncbi:hypothetical protein Ahy_B03g066717 [Arachis hypogaea]|uniref:Uncharacterized protein n=1 Tax=Arachis hypogaea TaxID=3818 RepID=A0A445A4U4_ARAHY|nr:hypothetical protein Ahy_B03g066717 [Arachis hypogaea]
MSSGQQQHQPPPPLKRIKTLSNREREQKLRKNGVHANDKQNFVEKSKVAKEKGKNLNKSKVLMEASMTHSQGSTCRQEKELPSKSTAMAHKNTTEVDSRMSQYLKRKETTIEDDIKDCGSLQERPTKKGKIRQFASILIDTFLKLNNEPDGPTQCLKIHFRKLIAYWRTEKVKAASKENNEPPTQAEMFVETRQSTKGKSLDEDTLDVIENYVEGEIELD